MNIRRFKRNQMIFNAVSLLFVMSLGVPTLSAQETSLTSLPTFQKKANVSWPQGPTTFGVGLNAGTTAGLSVFFSPLGQDIYSQFSANFNNDGDYSLFLDAAYPISSLFELSRLWDIYVGLGFIAGDLQRFPIRLGRSDVKLKKDELYFGVRIPIGIMYYIPNTPIQVGAEVAPSMVVSPKALPHLHAALVSRVVFEF